MLDAVAGYVSERVLLLCFDSRPELVSHFSKTNC